MLPAAGALAGLATGLLVGRRANARWAARVVTRHGRPGHLVYFGDALGDDLLCTAVFRELRERGRRGLWMMTRHAPLFALNPDVDAVVPWDARYRALTRAHGGQVSRPWYTVRDAVTDADAPPERHILALMCRACGVSGRVALRPYLRLSAGERRRGRIAPRQVVIQSSGASARWAMRNKEWFPDRFGAVVRALRGDYAFVQLGSARDPPLEGCLDLRGRTSVRESAAILSNALLFVGQVGFLMHLARAVDRPSVIVYGGRELPWQSGYSCNTNLSVRLPCSPCWRWNRCGHDRECMRRITVEEVVTAVVDRAASAEAPLAVDVDG